MAGVNKVILVGNLGIEPEIRTLENGTKVARLRVATSESYTNREGIRVENTEWHTVTLWRQLAEIAEKYLEKGKQVYIEGKLQTRSWKDKEGNDRYATEVIADKMQMLGRVSNNSNDNQEKRASQPAQQQSSVGNSANEPMDEDDDLPF